MILQCRYPRSMFKETLLNSSSFKKVEMMVMTMKRLNIVWNYKTGPKKEWALRLTLKIHFVSLKVKTKMQ
jgi:hypothetical protein